MILITAATGQVGRAALKALIGAGTEVRALVRDPSPFEAPEGVQVVHGDFEDDTSIAKALKGVSVMLLAGRDSPDSVSQHRRVLAQVRQAGVRHVVKLSAIGASPRSPIALMREHHEVDEEVRKGPAGWIFLKPHLYMQNLLRAADAVRREGRLAAPMGSNRFPLVDTRDVGAAAELVEASAATVEALARLHTRDALTTLLLIAERGSDEGVRVSAASRFLEIAERLGALRRPPRPRPH